MSALLVACPEHVTWDAAQAVCAQLGRGLAVPDTPERNPPVEEAVLRVHDALTDMGMGTYVKLCSRWRQGQCHTHR